MTYALREALRMMMEEGIEERLNRHARTSAALRAGIEALGLKVLADPQYRLNPLTAALVPEGVEDAPVRKQLLDDYNIEIGGGLGELGGKVWRIGLMGDGARESNVLYFAVGPGDDFTRPGLRDRLRFRLGRRPASPGQL